MTSTVAAILVALNPIFATTFLRVAQYLGYDPPEENLLGLLLAAGIDPNPHRASLIEDVQHGAFVEHSPNPKVAMVAHSRVR